jgi:hypothetical protein
MGDVARQVGLERRSSAPIQAIDVVHQVEFVRMKTQCIKRIGEGVIDGADRHQLRKERVHERRQNQLRGKIPCLARRRGGAGLTEKEPRPEEHGRGVVTAGRHECTGAIFQPGSEPAGQVGVERWA